MSKCCCCLSVTTGATILGVIAIFLATLELVPLVPYLIEDETFNPISDNLNRVFYILESMLEENKFDKEEVKNVIEQIKEYIWPVILGETIAAVVYALFSFFLILGVQIRKRGLMLPYMIIQMVVLIIFMIFGLGVTIGLFFLNIIMGVVCGVVVLTASFLLVYFWVVVQRAYVEIGTYAAYSQAPTVKPIYHMTHQYPSAPQHFQMDETSNGK